MVQRHVPPLQLFLLSIALGHLSIDPRLPGRLGGTALRPSHQELEGSLRVRSRECGDHAFRWRLPHADLVGGCLFEQ